MIQSIRARLLIWLLAAVVFTAVAGGYLMYRNALTQANAFFDSQLRLVALTLRDQAIEFALSPSLSRVEPEYDFVVQVWSWTGVRVYLSHPHTVLPGITTLGYSTVDTSAGRWRVYGVPARNYIIQVAQPLSVRSSRAVQLAWQTLRPLLFIVPLLAVVIWIAVGRNLQPLERMAKAVRSREPHELSALRLENVPAEVQPLVTALNDLLSRLSDVLVRERAFIADAAHELRSPLTALRLQVQNLSHELQPQSQPQVSTLVAGVDRATRLAEQLLLLARLDPKAEVKVPVRLDDIARDVVSDLVPLADQKQIDLGVTAAHEVTIRGDVDALRMLVRNLIDNAIRYTHVQGRVDVAVEQQGSEILFSVTDNGPGIPPRERARVFDRFYRVPGTAATGSGLGLAIVKTVAEAHGATIELSDAPHSPGLRVLVRFLVDDRADP